MIFDHETRVSQSSSPRDNSRSETLPREWIKFNYARDCWFVVELLSSRSFRYQSNENKNWFARVFVSIRSPTWSIMAWNFFSFTVDSAVLANDRSCFAQIRQTWRFEVSLDFDLEARFLCSMTNCVQLMDFYVRTRVNIELLTGAKLSLARFSTYINSDNGSVIKWIYYRIDGSWLISVCRHCSVCLSCAACSSNWRATGRDFHLFFL